MGYATIILVALCVGYLNAEKTVVHLEPEKLGVILQGVMPCLVETPLEPEVLMQLRNGERPKDVDAKKLQKFLHCAFIKTGYAKKNGQVKVDKALQLYPASVDKAELKKIMEECNRKEGKDPTETIANFLKCFKEKSPVKIVL